MNENDFDLWEKDQSAKVVDEIFIIQNTIDLAKELQYGVTNSAPRLRKQMGIEALELLNDYPNELKHHKYALNVHHLYLNVHPNWKDKVGYTSKYGQMRVLGNVGLYGLDRFDDSGWLITLQLFEPKQLNVINHRDILPKRIPAPLKVPVSAIEVPVIQIQ